MEYISPLTLISLKINGYSTLQSNLSFKTIMIVARLGFERTSTQDDMLA
jgi:hypothetical protein